MAFLPCQFGDHHFRGPSNTFYPAVVDAHESLRWKLRVCPEHAKVILDGLGPYEVKDSAETISVHGVCPSCLQRVQPKLEPAQNLYVTAYIKGQERRDFWGAVHVDCGKPAWLPYTPDVQPA